MLKLLDSKAGQSKTATMRAMVQTLLAEAYLADGKVPEVQQGLGAPKPAPAGYAPDPHPLPPHPQAPPSLRTHAPSARTGSNLPPHAQAAPSLRTHTPSHRPSLRLLSRPPAPR